MESDCPQADEYRTLARAIDENKKFVIPKPLPMDALEKLLIDFGLVDGVAPDAEVPPAEIDWQRPSRQPKWQAIRAATQA